MPWFPIGPDQVFTPRDPNFRRLSRRNEIGRQGLVSNIAIEPNDPTTIYVVENPTSGGTTSLRTRDAGASWRTIVDDLQRADPNESPTCIAINPLHPETVYLGCWSQAVYVSANRGDSWGPRNAVPGRVFKLVVDGRTAADLATTVVYAAANNGIYRSPDGGTTWVQVLTGSISSFVADIPAVGTANFYAGVNGTGVFHTTNAQGTWVNLNGLGIGLPAFDASTPASNFDAILVDVCRTNPSRVYVWLARPNLSIGLYTSGAALSSWSQIPATALPNPAYGYYCFAFAVAPNSPGDGASDILFFGSIGLSRSLDAGRTWQPDAVGFHADQHAFAFFPEIPPAGTVPQMYIGNDGGLALSTRFADRAFSFSTTPPDFGQNATNDADSGTYQTLNRGKSSSALYNYNSHPRVAALSYIGCQDTGIAAGDGDLGWRGIVDADAGAIAIAPATNGVTVWGSAGAYGDYPPWRILTFTDKGELRPGAVFATLGGGPLLMGTSAYAVGRDDLCLAGAVVRDSGRALVAPITVPFLSSPITTTGLQFAVPSSMAGISTGTAVIVDKDANQETVTVTATTATTFTASFARTHAVNARLAFAQEARLADMTGIMVASRVTVGSGATQEDVTVTAVGATSFTATFLFSHPVGDLVQLNRSLVVRIGHGGSATQISQDFGIDGRAVTIVAPSAVDPDVLFAATNDQRLWTTTSASTASSSTVWSEVTGGKPASISMGSITSDAAGSTFVLLTKPVNVGTEEVPRLTPLFRILGSNWEAQDSTNLPSDPFNFGRLVADPVRPNVLYATFGARVYRVALDDGWSWTDISEGLPGQWVYDLWVGNIGTTEAPKVLLRAGIPTRGVWECDVTAGASTPNIALYLRDNLLDLGWVSPSISGVPDPFRPEDPSATLFHYMCIDIKVDSRQPGEGAVPDFFQTDPETPLPITHPVFDELRDNSQNLPSANEAIVHVRANHRGTTPATGVQVWAIYCNASAGVPALSESLSSGNAFPFWSQFTPGGIVPALPADSPWHAVGAPVALPALRAGQPAIASWPWTIPTLPTGDPGHFCLVAFVHSAANPLAETGMIIDEIVPQNPQIGQKNLHISMPLSPGATPPGETATAAPPLTADIPGWPGIDRLASLPNLPSWLAFPKIPAIPGIHGIRLPPGGVRGMLGSSEYVEFHNPTNAQREATLVFDMRGLPTQIVATLQFTTLNTVKPLSKSLVGIDKKCAPDSGQAKLDILLERLAALCCWIEDFRRLLAGLPRKPCPRVTLPPFEPDHHRAKPSTRVEVHGVRIPPFGFVAAMIRLRNTGHLEPGRDLRYQVQQVVSGQVVGGSVYVVAVAGTPRIAPLVVAPSVEHAQDPAVALKIERAAEPLRFVPPWAEEHVEESEERLKKKF